MIIMFLIGPFFKKRITLLLKCVDGVQHADIVFETFAGFPSIYFCKGNTTLNTMEKIKKDAPAAAAGGGNLLFMFLKEAGGHYIYIYE